MALPSMRPQSPFFKPVATEAAVPGKDGSIAALQAEFDAMLLNTFVVVTATRALYYKGSLASYASGNRIVQLSSGASGGEGVDGVYTCGAGDAINDCVYISAANTVAKANATAVATGPAIGFIVAKPSTTSCVVRSFGEVGTETNPLLDVLGQALVADTTYYVSLTAGKITSDTSGFVAGNFVQKVGEAKNTTTLAAGVAPTFGGSFIANNGTDTDPTFTFGSDPDTGMYRFAANTIAFSLGGTLTALMQTDGFGYNGTDAVIDGDSTVLVVNHLSSGTTTVGFGTAIALQAQFPNGSVNTAGRVSAGLATAGAGTEQGRVDLLPAFAGTVAPVGIRTRAPSDASLLVNGLEVLPITAGAPATATGVSLAPYGATADVSLSLRPKGAGRTMLRDSGDTLTVLGVERVGSGALSGIVAWSSTATGATSATLNATSGVVTFTEDAATTLTITNTLVTTASLIFVNMQTATSNAVNIRRAVPTLDTITIELSGAPGVTNYAISFLVVNPAT